MRKASLLIPVIVSVVLMSASQQALASHRFTDVPETHTFHSDISWLADAGVTQGCNPPASTEFCPDDPVTRGQMAAFIVRAMGYTDTGGGDLFVDDDQSTFEDDIDKLATAGVTRGCNPPANDQFCPDDPVTRGQMAAFVRRALAPPIGLCEMNPISDEECQALISVFDPAGLWRSPPPWISNTDMCSWPAVACAEDHVAELDFRGTYPKGTIPPGIGGLSHLKVLVLGGINHLSGQIPSEIGNLTALEILEISPYAGSLTGPIPPEIGNLIDLRIMSIAFSDITGPIPPEIGNLVKLEELRLNDNGSLTGPIPEEIGNLTNLTWLSVPNGQLTGPIPIEIGNLTNLVILEAAGNHLSGGIPPEVGGMTSLKNLTMSANDLSGEVPAQIRDLPNIEFLRLRNQSGCLFTNNPDLADWLTNHDSGWNNGCP